MHYKDSQSELYVRYMAEIPSHTLGLFDEDDANALSDSSGEGTDAPIKIAICMLKEQSRHLLEAQYLQSDIAFKRVVGYYEFELGGWDTASRTSKTSSQPLVVPNLS